MAPLDSNASQICENLQRLSAYFPVGLFLIT